MNSSNRITTIVLFAVVFAIFCFTTSMADTERNIGKQISNKSLSNYTLSIKNTSWPIIYSCINWLCAYRCVHSELCAMQKDVRLIFYRSEMRWFLCPLQRKACSGLRGRVFDSSFPSGSWERLLILRIDQSSSTFSSSLRYNIKLRNYAVQKNANFNEIIFAMRYNSL